MMSDTSSIEEEVDEIGVSGLRTLHPDNQVSSRQLRRRKQSQIKVTENKLFPIKNSKNKNSNKLLKSLNPKISKKCIIDLPNVNNSLNVTNVSMPPKQPLSNFNFASNSNNEPQLQNQSTSNELEEISFKQHLAEWAVNERINHTSLRNLLVILKTHSCFNDLPVDSRTLLNTPRSLNIKEIDSGHYWHYGLKRGILSFFENNKHFSNNTKVELMIGIDGLPISKSSGSQLWPILGSILGYNEVFFIGIYHSISKKPTSSEQFLNDFVDEAKDIVENGLQYNNKIYTCRIKIICADTPAKSFILGVKGHTGYSSCTKCWDEGKHVERRMCFSHSSGRKRTDEEFFLKSDAEYHLHSCTLERIPHLGLVTNVVLDYLHLICLGVMKKLIHLWCCDSLHVRLQFRKVKFISDKLEKVIKPYTPYEFQRKSRGLIFYRQWKGTEFRQFLLYGGPVVLRSVLSQEIYEHFLSLHFAITLLISKKFCFNEDYLKYAEDLLLHFVAKFKIIYGDHHISHNVHGLLHLVDDVRNFGPLDTFSSFRYENFMQKLKVLIKKNDKPLQQIAKRLHEIESVGKKSLFNKNIEDEQCLKNTHVNGPIMVGCTLQYSIFKIQGMTFDINSKANNCCSLTNRKIIIIENFCYNIKYQNNIIIGKEFVKKKPLYTSPSSSSYLGIYEVSKLSRSFMFPLKYINGKYFHFPISENHSTFAAIPLLHIDQQERPFL